MSFGLRTTIVGPNISPALGLNTSQSDDADAAATTFGDRLLLRVDPRDVRKTTDNPTGRKRVHYQMPNRDPLVFNGSGASVGPVSGKYNAKDVFVVSNAGSSGSGTHNDLAVGPKSLNAVTEFSIFGVAHFDSGMLGSGTHWLLGFFRDKSQMEFSLVHQFSGGVNYLTLFTDQGTGTGGINIDIDSGGVVAAGTPFAYLITVAGTADNQTAKIFINQTATANVSGTGKNSGETGSIELYLGHNIINGNQWLGALGRQYVVQGDCLDTATNQAASAALMLELKTLYGIA